MTLTIPEIMSKIPGAFEREQAVNMNAVVHFRFTGSEAGEWNAVIRDGKCEVARGIPHSRPSITVTADSADFVRIVSGEVDGMKAFMDGRVKLAGDISLATRLVKMLSA